MIILIGIFAVYDECYMVDIDIYGGDIVQVVVEGNIPYECYKRCKDLDGCKVSPTVHEEPEPETCTVKYNQSLL